MSARTLAARLEYAGGGQLGRINKQKLNSFKWALKNDYNSRLIKLDNKSAWRCLINTNNLKSDYDKKYISIEFDAGLQPGDTFEILDDGTHWMVYLPILTETAYLRSEIIRCRYTINVNGKDYWVYFQGPTETDLRWFQKSLINANELNLSGTIYIKDDENTNNFFKRFTHIKMDGHIWEVQVTDFITVPGIIELEVQEYYDNTIAEIPEVREVDGENPLDTIKGLDVVKQNTVIGYSINNLAYSPDIHWRVENNPRVEVIDEYQDGRICKVKIHPGAVRTFDVCYGEQRKTVTIDWLKPIIQGPQEVYPYEIHTYWIKHKEDERINCDFSINSDLARIIDCGDDYCNVEIVSGKKGEFILKAKPENQDETTIKVEIRSL